MKKIYILFLSYLSIASFAQSNEVFLREVFQDDVKIAENYLIENSVKYIQLSDGEYTYEYWTKSKIYVMEIKGIRYKNVNFLVRNLLNCDKKLGNGYDIIVLSENGTLISADHYDDLSKALEPLSPQGILVSQKICFK